MNVFIVEVQVLASRWLAYFEQSSMTLKHMFLWCPTSHPHLITYTYHLNAGFQIIGVLELRMSALPHFQFTHGCDP